MGHRVIPEEMKPGALTMPLLSAAPLLKAWEYILQNQGQRCLSSRTNVGFTILFIFQQIFMERLHIPGPVLSARVLVVSKNGHLMEERLETNIPLQV